MIFLEKQIYSGINEMQIPTKLQNATNQNNFPYWNDILNIRSQFTKTWENQMLALIIPLFNSLSSNFQVMSKPIWRALILRAHLLLCILEGKKWFKDIPRWEFTIPPRPCRATRWSSQVTQNLILWKIGIGNFLHLWGGSRGNNWI